MRRTKRLFVILLCMLIMTITVTGEPAMAAKTISSKASTVKKTAKPPQNGWYAYSKNQKRYYRDGKYLKGYQKIGNNYYLFNKKGTQQKKDYKYHGVLYYIDTKGRVQAYKKGKSYYKVTGKRISKNKAEVFRAEHNAEVIVARITNKRMSRSQKLLACFKWVIRKPYHTWRRFDQSGRVWYAVYANDHFERGRGNCHADAAAFAYLAKELGYKNVYVCEDTVRTNNSAHGWCEINGLVYDPLFAEAKSFSGNYGVTHRVYPLSTVYRKKIA